MSGLNISVRRPTGWTDTDEAEYGDPPFSVSDCSWQPDYSTDSDGDLRSTVVTGYTLFAPYSADLRAKDEVTLPGDPLPWFVVGDVGRWSPSPFTGWTPGIRVALRRATG